MSKSEQRPLGCMGQIVSRIQLRKRLECEGRRGTPHNPPATALFDIFGWCHGGSKKMVQGQSISCFPPTASSAVEDGTTVVAFSGLNETKYLQ